MNILPRTTPDSIPATLDALTRHLALMATDAHTRGFGASEPRMEAWIRHGYLLALEEIERVLSDQQVRRAS